MHAQTTIKSGKDWAGVRAALSAATVSALLIFCPMPSHAAQPAAKEKPKAASLNAQSMKYDIYAGGFHVVSAGLDVDLSQKTRYLLRLSAFTHGMLAKLAPWHGVFQTKGWYDPKKSFPQPELHFSDTTWRDEQELTEFRFNKDGSFKEYRIRNQEENGPKDPEPGLADNSTDVLSATLKVMNSVAQTGKCEGKDKIFDGSRSYNLIFHHQNEAMLKSSDLNVYAGPATECTIEVQPLEGKWHSKPRGWMSIQEQGREKGTMPTIWLAQMAGGEPAVPVKIRVKTDYGTLFMHLTAYKGGGKTLALKK
jgi:hypothetical protein